MRHVARLAAQKKHLIILVVDESAAIRRIHDRLLSQEGHRVVCAASGSEGLNCIKKAKIEAAYGDKGGLFDVVIISHLMAGMTGPQTIANMRSQGFKGVLIVATSESSSQETAKMQESGADCVVVKPLSINAFKRALRGAMFFFWK